MIQCDLNCDMGEGTGNDEAIIPFITSANIACGFHAGDEKTMFETVSLANEFGVAIAPTLICRQEKFGRTEMDLPPEVVYYLITSQLKILEKMVDKVRAKLHHVKPHGALYNMAARDARLSTAIVRAVRDFNPSLIVYGLSGSYLISEAKAIGLRTASEVFADRTYREDGSLTPRSQSNALIENEEKSLQQVLEMVLRGKVASTSGKQIDIIPQYGLFAWR